MVLNLGSTSLKYSAFDIKNMNCVVRGKVDRIGSQDCFIKHLLHNNLEIKSLLPGYDLQKAVDFALHLIIDSEHGVIKDFDDIKGIGFKTVHGGNISGSVKIDQNVIDAMENYDIAAPAHNNIYLAAIRFFLNTEPNIPLVAVFETGFHSDMPISAQLYGVPFEWFENYGIRRYGFHGASHRFISERTAELLGSNKYRLISCHLGGSSSICAVRDGKSIDTSMGFSAQSGLFMANRVGDFDPYILYYLVEKHNFTHEEVYKILSEKSGLFGLSGLSGDIRDLEIAASNGHKRAILALDLLVYNVQKYIGAYATVLGGLDVIAFTGGIGENGFDLRAKICKGLSIFGISIDTFSNENLDKGEGMISSKESSVKVIVIPANEELIIAKETYMILN